MTKRFKKTPDGRVMELTTLHNFDGSVRFFVGSLGVASCIREEYGKLAQEFIDEC